MRKIVQGLAVLLRVRRYEAAFPFFGFLGFLGFFFLCVLVWSCDCPWAGCSRADTISGRVNAASTREMIVFFMSVPFSDPGPGSTPKLN